MGFVIQKFGGTSVATPERIKRVAERVVETFKAGDRVVVVLSAMAGQTDKLIKMAHEVSAQPSEREYDVLVSTGEQVSIALLSMAIEVLGYKARSFLGHQVRIVADGAHTKARILKIDTEMIEDAVKEGVIPVVAGFQGVNKDMDIATFGRGGSDITAVALSAALKTNLCEIYTDVNGIYTTDPAICPNARKLKKISYDEMLEMASMGARVLQTRSVEFARRYNVPLMVRSSFNKDTGTMVTMEDKDMENVLVSGITYHKDEAKISLTRVPDRPGVAARIFGPLAKANINVDMIIQNLSHEGFTDLTFTVQKSDFNKALGMIKEAAKDIKAQDIIADQDIAKISIVGSGMRTHAGVASMMFSVLSREGINIQMISTSEIKISCVIGSKYAELAVRVLHDAFELGNDEVEEEG
ncbi:MAG: aspartate kinase [Thermodesulfobacteriota bacterium]